MNIQDRMAQGRDIGEPFVRAQLKQYGIEIEPAQGYHQDAKLKIDGFWKGKPVQIKIRRGGRNDVAYEVLRNHDDSIPLDVQLKNPHQLGRDWRGQVEYYFVMTGDESEIHLIAANKLKVAVMQAVREFSGGRLLRSFEASTGVQLKPTEDPDPESFTPLKVMAFIPFRLVVEKTFPVDPNLKVPEPGLPNISPKGQPQKQGAQINPNWASAIDQAKETGQAAFPAPNNKKLLKPFERFAKKQGIAVQLQGGQVILKKVA